jgi:hypothetical protein
VNAQADVAEKLQKAQLASALAKVGVSDREKLRAAGYNDDQIEQIEEEKAEQDVLETDVQDVADVSA